MRTGAPSSAAFKFTPGDSNACVRVQMLAKHFLVGCCVTPPHSFSLSPNSQSFAIHANDLTLLSSFLHPSPTLIDMNMYDSVIHYACIQFPARNAL